VDLSALANDYFTLYEEYHLENSPGGAAWFSFCVLSLNRERLRAARLKLHSKIVIGPNNSGTINEDPKCFLMVMWGLIMCSLLIVAAF
jgi:hypothetical protein